MKGWVMGETADASQQSPPEEEPQPGVATTDQADTGEEQQPPGQPVV